MKRVSSPGRVGVGTLFNVLSSSSGRAESNTIPLLEQRSKHTVYEVKKAKTLCCDIQPRHSR